ncbi:MAG: hypothetical protein HQK96_03065 [Nitrospirae bacterium]|nr:hypothetical protein [Nitrospirota bacterium]
MHETVHVILSVVAGFITWKVWKRPMVSFFCAILSGVFVDIDHLVDYCMAFGTDFRMDWFLNGYYFLKNGKVYEFLHGWEYVVILTAGMFILRNKTAKSVCMALSLSLFFHLCFDTVAYGFRPAVYSVIYRADKGFDTMRLVDSEQYNKYMERKAEVFQIK